MWPHGRDPAPQGPALLRTLRADSAIPVTAKARGRLGHLGK